MGEKQKGSGLVLKNKGCDGRTWRWGNVLWPRCL